MKVPRVRAGDVSGDGLAAYLGGLENGEDASAFWARMAGGYVPGTHHKIIG
ncbi:hypothetical protein [Caldilinea sp.]|uniref:hypothetical protein n=1 Tax=Caldilinea sp. TaxID=2293560 RepID=UPI002D11EC8A|nr:hypothetical protein [Caldilinea sp.]